VLAVLAEAPLVADASTAGPRDQPSD
jgi:hypothetical protein